MSSKTKSCGGCGKFLSGGAVCTVCKTSYHKQCVNIASSQPANWHCPACVVKMPRADNSNTPVKGVGSLAPELSPFQSENNISPALERPLEKAVRSPQVSEDINSQRAILEEIKALRKDMDGFRKEFGCFREEVRAELKDLRSLYQGCENRIGAFEERLDIHDSRLNTIESLLKESSNKDNEDLRTQIQDLKQEINLREQLALQNDIEISGVTEQSGENIMQITTLLMNKIGLKVDERDIVEAHRVGPVRLGEEGKQRPRLIVLRLTRRAVRDDILRCARSRRNVKTGDIGVAGTPRPVYINERLTKENRMLFGRTRALCKQHSWKFAWTREGKILIREGDGKPAFRVRNERDISRIFKLTPANN